jgi:hypothetical protein
LEKADEPYKAENGFAAGWPAADVGDVCRLLVELEAHGLGRACVFIWFSKVIIIIISTCKVN